MKKILITLTLFTLGTRAFACALHGGADADYLRMLFADYIIDESCDIWDGMGETFFQVNSFLKGNSDEMESPEYEKITASDISFRTLRNGKGPTLLILADLSHEAESQGYVKSWFTTMARIMAALNEEWSGTLVLAAPISPDRAEERIPCELFSTVNIPEPDYTLTISAAPMAAGSITITTDSFLTENLEIGIPVGKSDFVSYLQSVLEASGDVSHIFNELSSPYNGTVPMIGAGQRAFLFIGITDPPVISRTITSPFAAPQKREMDRENEIIPLGAKITAKLALSVFQKGTESISD